LMYTQSRFIFFKLIFQKYEINKVSLVTPIIYFKKYKLN